VLGRATHFIDALKYHSGADKLSLVGYPTGGLPILSHGSFQLELMGRKSPAIFISLLFRQGFS
jgi:hypothetical protein